jgi:hypothetical protein
MMLAVTEDRPGGSESVRDSARLDQGEKLETNVRLSDAAIADLAQAVCVPEELFRMIIDRYPELTSALMWRFRSPHQSCRQASICTA